MYPWTENPHFHHPFLTKFEISSIWLVKPHVFVRVNQPGLGGLIGLIGDFCNEPPWNPCIEAKSHLSLCKTTISLVILNMNCRWEEMKRWQRFMSTSRGVQSLPVYHLVAPQESPDKLQDVVNLLRSSQNSQVRLRGRGKLRAGRGMWDLECLWELGQILCLMWNGDCDGSVEVIVVIVVIEVPFNFSSQWIIAASHLSWVPMVWLFVSQFWLVTSRREL